MPEAFLIGPFLVPTRVAGFLLSVFLVVWLVRRTALFLNIEATLPAKIAEHSLWIGIAASRLGHVVWNWSAFEEKPWTALYLWQPGYSYIAGVSAILIYAVYRIFKLDVTLRSPVAAALCGGFSVPGLLFAGILVTMNKFVAESILVPGDAVPQYEFTDLDGQPAGFDDFKGKGLVVNFWATWCAPCRREMSLLESVFQGYRNQGIVVIGISVGESLATVQRYVDSIGVTYPIWADQVRPNQSNTRALALSDRFNVVGLPTTFFVNRNGIIESSHVGELNRAIIQERILDLILHQKESNTLQTLTPGSRDFILSPQGS